jgi:hypothetical protein
MQYFITKEEVNWIVKDCLVRWQLPISKPVTRKIMAQSSRSKDKDELGSLARKNSLTDNTRMSIVQNQPTKSNAVPKRPRKKETGTSIQSQTIKGKRGSRLDKRGSRVQ